MTFNVSCPAFIVASLAPAISDEPTRYYLRGIFFEGAGYAVATDGNIMTVTQHDETVINSPGIYPVSKAAVTKAKSAKADKVVIADGLLKILDVNGNALHIEPCNAIDGTFPDWRRIVPVNPEKPCTAAFAGSVMQAIVDTAKVAGRCKAENATFTFRAKDAASPHLVRYGNGKESVTSVFSVVMPYRCDWDATTTPFSV